MSTPCAACKYLRRKCTEDCLFAPYFPVNKQENYTSVHKVFGASHVASLLKDIHPHQRQDAMNSLVYEAQACIRDPIYGCTRDIYLLQRQLKFLQDQIQIAKNELATYTSIFPTFEPPPPIRYQQNHHNPMVMPTTANYGGRLTAQQLQQLHEEAHRFATVQTAQMPQTLETETETQHNQRAMIDHDKKISSKI